MKKILLTAIRKHLRPPRYYLPGARLLEDGSGPGAWRNFDIDYKGEIMKNTIKKFLAIAVVITAAGTARAGDYSDVLGAINAYGGGEISTLVLAGAPDADYASLYVYTGPYKKPLVKAIDLVFKDAWHLPSIKGTDNGSILIESGVDAGTRDHWKETLTLSFRDGGLLLSGYTYIWMDTFDPSNHTECDLNLLTGKGVRNGKAITFDVKASSIGEWDSAKTSAKLLEGVCSVPQD